MHEPLTGLLERADLAIAASRTVVSPELLDPLARVVTEARTRLLYPEEVLVVALAGGTGSGKSSLFNLLTETDEAVVGVARPTTSEALAAVPERFTQAFDVFLDEIGVTRQTVQNRLPGICLLDLPDTDSVETDHRLRVEAIMPRLDVMVWVVDPEKYRDAALHHRYLQPLSDYSRQFVVVLNQIDRLDTEAVDQVTDDLKTALAEDGLRGVPVVRTSAAPSSGPPVGVDQLSEILAAMVERPDLLYSKLVTDLDRAARELAGATGGSLGYRDDAERVISMSAQQVADGTPGAAVDGLVEFVSNLAGRVDGPMAASLQRLAATIPAKVQGAVLELPQPPARKWWRRGVAPDRLGFATAKMVGILEPVEELLAVRARAVASVAEFALAVTAVNEDLQTPV